MDDGFEGDYNLLLYSFGALALGGGILAACLEKDRPTIFYGYEFKIPKNFIIPGVLQTRQLEILRNLVKDTFSEFEEHDFNLIDSDLLKTLNSAGLEKKQVLKNYFKKEIDSYQNPMSGRVWLRARDELLEEFGPHLQLKNFSDFRKACDENSIKRWLDDLMKELKDFGQLYQVTILYYWIALGHRIGREGYVGHDTLGSYYKTHFLGMFGIPKDTHNNPEYEFVANALAEIFYEAYPLQLDHESSKIRRAAN